jgi:hypothetical protein
MKSIVEVDINLSKANVRRLFTDPANNPKWMDDLKKYEAISGDQGMPDSSYRLIPKKGNRVFTAFVIAQDDHELKLKLDSHDTQIMITARLIDLSPSKTRLISEEVFTFKGLLAVFGWLAKPAIHKAHRKHMIDFRDFAENTVSNL